MPRVAIVGGGLAGLAAAARLHELGVAPIVFEQGSAVGGVVRTCARDGWLVDQGPALAAEPPAAVRALLDRAGVDMITVRAAPAAANRYIVRDGSPIELPHTTAEFTSSSVLSLGGRLRLLKERFVPAATDPEETVAAFAARRFGAEMAERMFDPLLASMSSGLADQVLARYAFPAVVGHEQGGGSGLQGSAKERMQARRRAKGKPRGSWSCSGGMQELARRLAGMATVRTTAAVHGLRATTVGVDIRTDAGIESFDAAIVALPAPAYRTMIFEGVPTAPVDAIATLPCASVAVVSLGFRRDQIRHPLAGSRILIPAVEKVPLLSVLIPTTAFADHAPAGHVLLTAFVGGARHPDCLLDSDADIAAMVQRHLATLLGITGGPAFTEMVRWPEALPQAIRGHAARLAAADAIEIAAPRLALTGAWRDGMSVSEVLGGGMSGADRLARAQRWVAT